MILSVCPNPSIDCTMELEKFYVGQLNRVSNKIVTYSGKALNTAIGVRRLGGDSFATGFMYENEGSLFVATLDNEGVKNSFVWSKGSVRTNYKIVDHRSMLTEINDKGEKVSLENQQKLVGLVGTLSKSASVVCMSGSLPDGVADDYYQKLISACKKGVKVILDTAGEKLIKALSSGVYMVKPNLLELEAVAGEKLKTRADMIKYYLKNYKLFNLTIKFYGENRWKKDLSVSSIPVRTLKYTTHTEIICRTSVKQFAMSLVLPSFLT